MGFMIIFGVGLFADFTIGVQRDRHIPSFWRAGNSLVWNFVLKVVAAFPNVDLYWPVVWEGVFPRNQKKPTTPIKFSDDEVVKK